MKAEEQQSESLPQPELNPVNSHMPSGFARAMGHWIHDHKASTSNNLFGYTAYQYIRSAIASIPYGFSMAGTWLAFDSVGKWTDKTLKPIEDYNKTVPEGLHKKLPSLKKYTRMFVASPLVRTGAMIGTSFTLYRATSKICKWTNEYLFNPEDSLETTIDKVEHLPEMLQQKAKEVYMPEMHSTFISALVLSALVCYGIKTSGSSKHLQEALGTTKELLAKNGKFSSEAWGHFWKEAIANPKSEFVPQAAINSLAYSLFFELGDRRFKDKQISRGMWAGRTHSIGSSSKSHPSLLQEPIQHEGEPAIEEEADDRITTTLNEPGELPQGSRMGDKLSIITSEPSFLRFFGRRFIPTAAGITAYTALKFRGGKLFFGDFVNTPKAMEEVRTVKGFLRNSWAEGAATSLFFMIPWVTDKYAPVFDRFVNNLEAAVSGRSYDEVVAGYQPKQPQKETMLASSNDNHPKANNDNTKLAKTAEAAPNAKVAQPVEHQARIAKETVADLHA